MLIPTEKSSLHRSELRQALTLFKDWFSCGELDRLQPTGPAAVYNTSVTLWLLISQRLHGGMSLNATVKRFISEIPDFVPANRRLRDGTLSTNSSSYSDARKRLQLPVIRYLFDQICDSIVEKSPRVLHGRKLFLLDGTTFTLEPTDELRKCFPPATNQHGESVWPNMMVFVAHELATGCAMFPQIGAMYGNKNTSELKMARQIVHDLPTQSIVVADAGLGIFAVAHEAQRASHHFVMRLKADRFRSYTKRGRLVSETSKGKVWELDWKPTSKERKTTPELPADASLNVRIHEFFLEDDQSLYLITSLRNEIGEVAELYSCRFDVETDIRDIKVTLNTENIRAQSEEMVRKELYTSLIAYNLVIQFRRQAASLANVPPRRLSFRGAWDTYQAFLLRDLSVLSPEDCISRYEQALEIASRDKIPERPGRSYRRAAHPRRPKTTKWQKAQRKTKTHQPQLESIKQDSG